MTATDTAVQTPTAEDLMTFFDLRKRIEGYFEQAGEAWLHAKMDENAPGYEHVTNRSVFLERIDPEGPVFDYYPDAWHSRNQSSVEVTIPMSEFVPEYAEAVSLLAGLSG